MIAVLKMQTHKLKFHSCCFSNFRIFVKYRVRQQFLCTATTNFPAAYLQNSWEICCACARFPLKLEDFPEELTKCSWLLYIFECLFNLYNFFAGRDYFAGLKVTKRNKATVLLTLTLTLLQTPTLTLTLILTLT